MTPPEAPAIDAGNAPPAVSVRLEVIKTRKDFLAAARARHHRMTGMMVQGRNRHEAQGPIRVGFTCSKKVGNAVARNRAKRRLREVARQVLPNEGRAGWDYVLIGRAEVTAARDFSALVEDLRQALKILHGPS